MRLSRTVGAACLTVWSAVEAEPGDEPALFAFLVDHAEQVRAERRAHGPLVCHNIALFGPADDREAKRLMEVVHGRL